MGGQYHARPTIGQVLIRGAITGAVLATILIGFGLAVLHGMDKEAARLDAVREYNCEHYGAAINKHYGRELCPPTPQG